MADPGRLQIHTVESTDGTAARCVVRCVGGTVRPGETFTVARSPAGDDTPVHLTLTRINRYGHQVALVDPPHSALVDLSGAGTRTLVRGTVLTAAPAPVTEATAPPAGSAGTS
ncbi:hypothetical protein AB0D04_08675 [Streptomyces sp. NPDC048483]|uniref:hypothetical protein n=1 Tax=Streptomyces sp. NPDC048483 TaxID=3154927 RepID=UPI0034188676